MRRGLAALVIALGALAVGAPQALATINVNTTKDELVPGNAKCSLREATIAALGTSEPDCPGFASSGTTTIQVPAGTYHLTLGSQLFLSGNVAIHAPSSDPSMVTINADGHDRVFEIEGQAEITGMTITGGRTFQGRAGEPSIFSGAGGNGGDGGGILNLGMLTLRNVLVTGNRTGNGGAGATGTSGTGCPGGDGGPGGSGGGVYNYNQSLTLDHVVITNNRTGDGAGGGEGGSGSSGCTGGVGGGGGDGGGLLSLGQVNMVASTIIGNATGNGGKGGEGSSGASGLAVGGTGGVGGAGGGLAQESSFGNASITGSTISGNQAGPGGQGGTGASRLSGSNGQTGGVGGLGGLGGGVYNAGSSSQTSVVNSTIAGNTAGDGGYGGQGGDGAQPGFVGGTGGQGGTGGGSGGIYNYIGAMTLTSVTLAGNGAGGAGGPGPGGIAYAGGSPGVFGPLGTAGQGGSITVDTHFGAAVNERDTLISGGTPGNCIGPFTDLGHNLSFPDTSCPHAVTGDPKLGPLGDYGGATQTLALQAGSAAIDQVPASGAGCPATDQRGVVRPQPAGGACDIGAYEYAPPLCRAIAAATHGSKPVIVQLSCGDPARVAVQYAIVHGPAHGRLGTLGATSGKVTYTAKSGFAGTDRFTYRALDANGTAASQTVTITVAPVPLVISKARLSRRRFRVDVGTKFEFTLSLTARVQIAITHERRGRTVTAGTLSENERAGKDSFKFNGRINGLALRRGSYKATLVASAGGRRSKPVALKFTITG